MASHPSRTLERARARTGGRGRGTGREKGRGRRGREGRRGARVCARVRVLARACATTHTLTHTQRGGSVHVYQFMQFLLAAFHSSAPRRFKTSS